MNEAWIVYNKKADFYQLAQRFSIDPVIARIIRNRDVITEKEFDEYLNARQDLYDPRQMKDMEKGAAIIKDAIEQKQKIRIISDYDVDGVMSY